MTRKTKGLPIRRNNFDAQGFLAFLASQGCEIGKPSNQYEVVRYRAYWNSKKPVTHIVYAKENGLLTWMQGSQGHYQRFLAGQNITGNNPPFVSQFDKPTPRSAQPKSLKKGNAPTRAKLLSRDGDECWFCGTAMGDDCTIEHLVPKSKGGRNALANYALAHSDCNQRAGDLPLVDKIELRAQMRRSAAAQEAR